MKSFGVGSCAATSPGVRRMPMPIVPPIVTASPKPTPSTRSNAPFDLLSPTEDWRSDCEGWSRDCKITPSCAELTASCEPRFEFVDSILGVPNVHAITKLNRLDLIESISDFPLYFALKLIHFCFQFAEL